MLPRDVDEDVIWCNIGLESLDDLERSWTQGADASKAALDVAPAASSMPGIVTFPSASTYNSTSQSSLEVRYWIAALCSSADHEGLKMAV